MKFEFSSVQHHFVFSRQIDVEQKKTTELFVGCSSQCDVELPRKSFVFLAPKELKIEISQSQIKIRHLHPEERPMVFQGKVVSEYVLSSGENHFQVGPYKFAIILND